MTSLYRSPRSGAQQALAFLSAHREIFVELLRNVTRSTTTIAVEEGRLLVSMLAMVVQKVSEQDRTGGGAGGFRDFHSGVMEIAGVTFDGERVGELISSLADDSGCECLRHYYQRCHMLMSSGESRPAPQSSDLDVSLRLHCWPQGRSGNTRLRQW